MQLEPNRIVINDDCLIIDSDFGAIPIRGAAVIALARKALPLLDGRGIKQVLASFDTKEAADVELLVRFFERCGVVQPEDAGCDALRPLFTAGGHPASLSLADMTLGVVRGSVWADDVIAELASANARVRVVERADECDLLDLIVVVSDSSDTGTHRRCAGWARQRQIAVLHGNLSPTEITVGPLFRPGAGACWNCAQFRTIANQPHAVAAHLLDESRNLPTVASGRHSGAFRRMAASILGVEALKAVLLKADALLSRVWVFNPLSLTASRHLIVPLPSCDVCGGSRTINQPSLFALNLDCIQNATSLGAFPGWIDARTGVITAAWFENEDLECGPYFVSAQLSAYSNSNLIPVAGDFCGGKGIRRVDAVRSGIGEALERYSAARVDTERIHYAAAPRLSGDVLTPEAMGLYARHQYDSADFPFVPFDLQQDYHWIEGVWLSGEGSVWVPADSAFFSPNSLGDRLCQVTSSGLALGRDLADASARALLELVERDATMLTWLCRLPGHCVILDQHDDAVETILHRVRPLDVTVEFYLLDVEVGIPTVLACGFGDGKRWPGLCVGSAAHPSARAALKAAALEMVYTAQGLQRSNAPPVGQPEAIRSDKFSDHALYYVSPERADSAAFLRGRSSIKYSLLPEIAGSDAVQLADMLAAAGIRVAVVDVTSADVALSGLRVVRALADGLVPIHCGHRFARCGARRLRDRGTAINPDPHPFC